MLKIGDLVRNKSFGEIGIVIRRDPKFLNYYYVHYHNGTFTHHKSNLEPLEVVC